MDYDFSRLSTRSFEQLVQALAAAVMGPGIVIFGDGPDGGREATFNGRIPFPNTADQWHGYGVVQAKFRQRPEGSGKDGAWALAELEKEVDKFVNSGRDLRKPEYYLFVTNVVLTPVAETGGKDKLTQYLESQKSELGLKDFRIWDYDQLRVLLDGQTDVRTAYTAWVTSGDVLAKILETMQPRQKDFRAMMRNYVQKELRADQYAKLGQAGYNPNDHIPLARVFVDLPTGDPRQTTGAIVALQVLAAQRLDPRSNPQESGRMQPSGAEVTTQIPGRVVFIGGPGQGKSTLSQFLCQLHRVALLKQEEQILLTPEAKDACALICQQCAHEALELPNMPRFPVRVELNHFAANLADGKATSLFDYLLQRIGQCAERDLSADDLRDWLAAYPWLLVLDGLDEVPASSNRSEVLAAVQNFLVDAQGCNADLLLVATTRPQGYNDDFSPRYYRHAQLLPLDVPRALHYAGRLVEQRWGGDADKVEKLMQRLERAGAEDATARLMQSPLQVTIMALLVETIGQPPKERWRLFNEYYQVIFRREKERDIPAAELLNAHQTDIDTIHQQVGLRLQADSERTGGTEALLPQDEFAQIVERRLAGEGHTGTDGERLRQAIMDAALERLVFLVAPQAGKIGFEIRSLQEFMAAQCLTNGSDEDVRERLRAIAPASHWRNVFLFAAGRCFHEKQHLHDSLLALCHELNEGEGTLGGGELEKAILAGSRLALDILEDGALARQPTQLKTYTRLALRLMELPPCPEQPRLAKLYIPELEELYWEEIKKRLDDGTPERRLGAWRVLLQLVYQGEAWAQSLAETRWPADPENGIQIAKAADGVEVSDWLLDHWAETIPKVSPIQTHLGSPQEWNSRWLSSVIDKLKDRLVFLKSLEFGRSARGIQLESISRSRFELILVWMFLLNEKRSPVLYMPAQDARKEWSWLVQAGNFADNCSKEQLAYLLAELASWKPEDRELFGEIYYCLPWVVQACVEMAGKNGNFQSLANSVLSGALGGAEDWKRAEERWENQGVRIVDSHYIPESGLPFDRHIAEIGFPFIISSMAFYHGHKGQEHIPVVLQLQELWRLLPPSLARQATAENLLLCLAIAGENHEIWGELNSTELQQLATDKRQDYLYCGLLGSLPDNCWKETSGIEALQVLGESHHLIEPFSNVISVHDLAFRLECLVTLHPNKGGLLRLLSIPCLLGHRPSFSSAAPNPDTFSDPRHKAAAILIRVAQADWLEDEATRLADRLAGLGELSNKTINNTLSIIEKQEMTGHPVEVLLTRIYSLLPPSAWETSRNLLQAMQEQQRRRLTGAAILSS